MAQTLISGRPPALPAVSGITDPATRVFLQSLLQYLAALETRITRLEQAAGP